MPFIRRVGRPGLLGVAARSAVAAATATTVSGAVARRQQQRSVSESTQMTAAESAAAETLPAPGPDPVRAPTTAAGDGDLVSKLQQLATLQQQGVLSAEEFALAKRQLLGG